MLVGFAFGSTIIDPGAVPGRDLLREFCDLELRGCFLDMTCFLGKVSEFERQGDSLAYSWNIEFR